MYPNWQWQTNQAGYRFCQTKSMTIKFNIKLLLLSTYVVSVNLSPGLVVSEKEKLLYWASMFVEA